MTPRWKHRLETVFMVALTIVGGAIFLAALEYFSRPKCPKCGKRMQYTVEWGHA